MRRTGRPRTVRTDVARAVIEQCLEHGCANHDKGEMLQVPPSTAVT